MRKLVVFLAAVFALLLAGCYIPGPGRTLKGSGRMAGRDYDLSGFTRLDVDSAFTVRVTRGDDYKVTVTTDDNLLDRVTVSVDQGTLRIAMNPRGFATLTSTRQEATITMPELASLRLDGASRATMEGFGPVPEFAAKLDGASRLSGAVQAETIRLEVTGASRLDLSGSGTNLTLNVTDAGQANLGDLEVKEAAVNLHSASRADLTVSAKLDYDLSELSHLTYSGNPAIGQSRSEEASSVIRR